MYVAHCIHEGSVIHRHADEIGSICHQSRCYRDRERPGDFIEFKSLELQQYLDRQLPTKKIFLRGKNNRRAVPSSRFGARRNRRCRIRRFLTR